MFKLAALILCTQALLIQSVYSQYAQGAILPAVNSCGCGGSSIALGGLSGINNAGLINGINNVGLINGVNSGYGAGCGGSSIALGGLSAANAYNNVGLINGINNAGLINGVNNVGLINGVNSGYSAGFGGSGQGQLIAEGALGVGGNTELIGSLPVVGLTQFGATIPAGGLVSIVGNTPGLCGCSCPSTCSSGYLY